jgi:hypothetical protein
MCPDAGLKEIAFPLHDLFASRPVDAVNSGDGPVDFLDKPIEIVSGWCYS